MGVHCCRPNIGFYLSLVHQALANGSKFVSFLWPPCVADADIIFLCCGFFLLLSFFFPLLISAVPDWMSTIFPHI